MSCCTACRPETDSTSAATIPKKTARLMMLLRSVRECAASSSGVSSIVSCILCLLAFQSLAIPEAHPPATSHGSLIRQLPRMADQQARVLIVDDEPAVQTA